MMQTMLRERFMLFCLFTLILTQTTLSQQLSLAGQWNFAIDKQDKGITEQWFLQKLSDHIQLPGSMTGNGKGDDITLQTKWTGNINDSSFFFSPRLAKYRTPDNLKIPFWLTPAKHYMGAAWYQKEIMIPSGWKNKRIVLHFERVHTDITVWVDGKKTGDGNTLVMPEEFDATEYLQPGKHTITLRIDNRIGTLNVGPNSHSISDHTQGNWNGVIGKIYVEAASPVYFDDIQVFPDVANKKALVKLKIVNTQNQAAKIIVNLAANSFNTSTVHQVPPVSATVSVPARDTAYTSITLALGDKMLTWDEFNPALYTLTASLAANANRQQQQVQFGMRSFTIQGTRFLVNGRQIFLRGTVNCSEFPLTGYPATDMAYWEHIFSVAKEHGLNHMRFHSWCPPEIAFIVADKMGFYLQPEAPTWPNNGVTLGDGQPVDQFIYEETNRMTKTYGNHPSFCMLAAGNEPGGKKQAEYLAGFVQYWQHKDSRRVYTGASVGTSWPLVPENQYMVKSRPRGLNWDKLRPETETDYRDSIAGFNVPYVTHEMGQWCVFPNFAEIKKYTGIYKAKNFELFQEDLKDHHMGSQGRDFFMASGKLQALCYKQEIEKTLRTPGLAGFQLLGLQDFPGQGTALVGMIDAFWDSKGYISSNEFSRFCNNTVPLTRLHKFVYSNNETFTAAIELAHFGSKPLKAAVVTCIISDDKGNLLHTKQFPAKDYAIGNGISVGEMSFPLSGITKATKLLLKVVVNNTPAHNDWNFWVYPSQLPEVNNNTIYYCDTLDAKAQQVLEQGGKVFLNAAGKVVKGKEVVMYFTPVFWNTSWFKMRPPHVTGILVQDKHPAFADFPTAYHSDLQWWDIVNRSQVMNLEDFPDGFKPLVQPIDTWFMNRRLALVMEARVGKGRLIVSSADLTDSLANRPAARQLKYSLEQYILSDRFNPATAVDLEVIRDIFKSPSRQVWSSYSSATPDELKPIQKKTNNE
jgi:Glycosyl hydrolases family 2, sugar binding domain/Glycosyl hydrolases family 2/Glycosyl hydrolases family 2, TIM barrel domain